MDKFELAHAFTAKWEGGISDDKNDAGGHTVYGVATHFLKDVASTMSGRLFLRDIGVKLPVTRENMNKITRAQAARIFRREFWRGLEEMVDPCALVAYDASVNHGRSRGVKFIQQAARNASGRQIAIDGVTGPATRAACALYPMPIAVAAINLREAFYHNLVAQKPSQKVFLKGWLNRVADLRLYLRNNY